MVSPERPNDSDQALVQTVLEPLLDDFQYWFHEASTLLTSPTADTLAPEQRYPLLEQVKAAQKEVAIARTLLLATGGQAGVDTAIVGSWHQLVSQCWQVARYLRHPQSQKR